MKPTQHRARIPALNCRHLFAAFERFRVLAAIRETDRGVNHLHAQLRQILTRSSQTWYPGRPILITRNDDSLNLFNGDVGICLPDPDQLDRQQPKVWFRAQGGFRAYRLPTVARTRRCLGP
jgi:exodeoxyribonuclease V alpha subunit